MGVIIFLRWALSQRRRPYETAGRRIAGFSLPSSCRAVPGAALAADQRATRRAYPQHPPNPTRVRIPRGQVFPILERCKGCQMYVEFCPQRVLRLSRRMNAQGDRYPEIAPSKENACVHNIEALTPAEVEQVEGRAGSFEATIRQGARFVTDPCARCGKCMNVCPLVLPNEFDVGMAARKAICTLILQSAPCAYVIHVQNVLNDPPHRLPCHWYVHARQLGAIDFLMLRERQRVRRVGTIIVTVGYETIDPGLLREFRHGAHPDILTALEFELHTGPGDRAAGTGGSGLLRGGVVGWSHWSVATGSGGVAGLPSNHPSHKDQAGSLAAGGAGATGAAWRA
jgi:ferredoxin